MPDPQHEQRLDLGPAAEAMAIVTQGISDQELAKPTPCPDYSVGDLLDHVVGLTGEFTRAARREPRPDGVPVGPGNPTAARLSPDWRERLPGQLDQLVAAWRRPEAWEGIIEAGGVTMPADVAALVTLDELVLHGWDLAKATGRPYEPDDATAQAVYAFTSMSAAPGQEAAREGIFGPVVEVPDDAPLFDRALGLGGRDPRWTPDT
jgi:uncharacterized protein (TIGR03086 family)